MLLSTKRIVYSGQMQEMDKKTITEFKIPGEVLMESAGRTASRVLCREKELSSKSIAILCGPGNNGGDGFVMARYLHQRALSLKIILLCKADKLTGDALINYKRVKALGIDIRQISSESLDLPCMEIISKADIIIDALFGTGLRSGPKGIFGQAIEIANSENNFIAAVDIPSGIEADTGIVLETAIKADLTITFGFPKPGHFIGNGKIHTGKLFTADIGIPQTIINEFKDEMEIISKNFIDKNLIKRSENSHKGNFGHLLVMGGSSEKMGACVMASKAAHRSGAGLVTICYPNSANGFSTYDETMKKPVSSQNGEFSIDSPQEIEEFINNRSAIVVGPGMGTGKGAESLMEYLIKNTDIPMVIDADALNIIAKKRQLLKYLDKRMVLTPHPKEMSRLTGISVEDILNNQIKAAKDFAMEFNCSLVLKTSTTIIASHQGKIKINTSGNPGMATGGSGDILAGIIGSLIANGIKAFDAASLGAFLHGFSADLLAEEKGPFGYLPLEVAENLPKAFKILQN